MRLWFVEYPAARAGVALVLLRASIASLLAMNLNYSQDLGTVATVGLYLLATALLLGIMTRLAAATCIVLEIAAAICGVCGSMPLGICHIFDATALLLMGPGALSIDAKLYGLRIVS